MPVIMPVKPFPDKWSLFVKMLSRYILKYVKLAKYNFKLVKTVPFIMQYKQYIFYNLVI